jgi:predicted ArsR family transcriptional regulator
VSAADRERPCREAVLAAVRDAPDPIGVTELAERVGVHPNTARFHLDALVSSGAVERAVEPPSGGPGRPRTVYTARGGMDRGGMRGYQLLAQVLLSRLVATEREPGELAIEAGRAWGRYLVESPPPYQPVTGQDALDRLDALLTELGFEPEPATGVPGQLQLRHCPFLELAESYGEVVCPLHLGLMQGALSELGGPVAATGLEPFAEPDRCTAHVARVPA